LENGQIISNASVATYVVPSGKAAGQYTYIRQAKSADCSEWQSSNEFVVTVFDCAFTPPCTETGCTATFTDPRDGKSYKTVVMPDGKTWFAQNLNYTKDLTYNVYGYEANGKQFTSVENGVPAIGSYWCPSEAGSVTSGSEADCRTYGALYTWETAMMVDGKYADETKISSAWDESWVSSYYCFEGPVGTIPYADKNNGRGGTNAKGGGSGICPMGWHIPTAKEWAEMLDKVDGDGTGTLFINGGLWEYIGTDVGVKLKSTATYIGADPGDGSWIDDPINKGTDQYNFTLIPAGRISRNGMLYARGYVNQLWHSSILNDKNVFVMFVYSHQNRIHWCPNGRYQPGSVRCVLN
jgi:uncharacterized protein (TIGR02145 family)